jgi:hypothetical protein
MRPRNINIKNILAIRISDGLALGAAIGVAMQNKESHELYH